MFDKLKKISITTIMILSLLSLIYFIGYYTEFDDAKPQYEETSMEKQNNSLTTIHNIYYYNDSSKFITSQPTSPIETHNRETLNLIRE